VSLTQVVGVAGQQQVPVLEEDDRVDDRLDVGDQMSGDEHESMRVEITQDAVEDDLAGGGIHTGDGFVEQVDAGTPAHGQGDAQLLPHALAHLLDGTIDGQCEEVDKTMGLIGIEVGEQAGELGDRPRRRYARGQELSIRQEGHEILGLRSRGVSAEKHLALVVGQNPGEDLEQGGLAAAVGTHETDDASGRQGQAQIVQGGPSAVGLGQATHGDQRRGPVQGGDDTGRGIGALGIQRRGRR
jgi:hypothetical protein